MIMHKSQSILAIAGLFLAAASAQAAFTITIEDFSEGNIPYGYAYLLDGATNDEPLDLSAAPFIDYMVPNNQGSAGITAEKVGGQYFTSSTVAELPGGGANRLVSAADSFRPLFNWSDGDPLPFAEYYFGVSWGGFSVSEVATLETQITFPDASPVRVIHWFNDQWPYTTTGHNLLEGHRLTVTLFDGVGNIKHEEVRVLPGGGAEDVFGDGRQFYTGFIDVTGHAAGDILIIRNEGGNVGFEGAAVAVLDAPPPPPPPSLEYEAGVWTDDPSLGWLFGVSDRWVFSPTLGFVLEQYPWLYAPAHGWFADFRATTPDQGLFLDSDAYGLVWVAPDGSGSFWIYGENRWASF